jgi:hypothetical protein
MALHSTSDVRRTVGFLTLTLALCGSSAQGKNLETDSRWAEGGIVIDGRSKDWQSVQGIFLSEQNAAFTFNNDGEYLYVLFRTTDQGWARTIKMTGLTLYFDVTGGKKKSASICFKGGPTMEQAMAMKPRNARSSDVPAPPGGGQGPRGMIDNQTPSLTCRLKGETNDRAVPLDGSAGPAAAFDTCQGFFTYEFRIPLAAGEGDQYGLGARLGQTISVGGVWGDMGEKAQGGPDEGMGGPGGGMGGPGGGMGGPGGGMGGPGGGMGGPGGGMGGPGGGMGGPGGGMGGPGGERPKMPEKQEVWIKTTTAVPQSEETGKTK